MSETFAAFTAEKTDDGFHRGVTELTLADLPDGEVVVDVEWSSVNYKDALGGHRAGPGRPDLAARAGHRPRGHRAFEHGRRRRGR